MSTSNDDERLVDLLVERQDRALTPAELTELKVRLEHDEHWREDDLELAEAALWASVKVPSLPAHVREKLQATLASAPVVALAPTARPAGKAESEFTKPMPVRVARRGAGWGWAAAALAAGLALFGWWPRLNPTPPVVIAPPTLAQQRAELLRSASAQKLDWAAAGDPLVKAIAGDVVWDSTGQSGFMRFAGLPKNDPTQHQYQLWIFDAARDERYPVDGGVFDIGADGEALVAIAPKVHVSKPTLFAVTLEAPGGVVVSNREHILVVAKVL